MDGGQQGTTNYFEVIRADGENVRGGRVTNLPLAAGDLVRVVTGNGGGWGDPRERERELVLERPPRWVHHPRRRA